MLDEVVSSRMPVCKMRELRLHRNPGLEICYLPAGRLTWHVEGRTETLMPQCVFFTLPWQIHGAAHRYEPGIDLYFTIIPLDQIYTRPRRSFAFDPSLQLGSATTRRLAQSLSETDRHCYPAGERMPWLLPAIVAEYGASDGKGEYLAHLQALAILELERLILRQPHLDAADPTPLSVRRIEVFVHQLETTYAEPWTLGRMAEKCQVGRTRLHDVVYELTGESPTRYLNRIRVRKAVELMCTRRMTATRAAIACGFSSNQYFARVCHDFTGFSPTACAKAWAEDRAG